MRTEIKTTLSESEFEKINDSLPNTLVYSAPYFMDLISRHVHGIPKYLVAKKGIDTVGVLPFIYRVGAFGTVINSLPYFGSNGGVMVTSGATDVAEILVRDLIQFCTTLPDSLSLTIVENPLEPNKFDYTRFGLNGPKDSRIGQVTHFGKAKSPLELLDLFDDPRPRNIRAAIKRGVTVEESRSLSALRFLYQTHTSNMESIGGKSKSWDFFESIPECIPDDNWSLYVANLEGKPIGALLVFKFNHTIEYFTPAILGSFRNTQALSLLIYQAMLEGIAAGYTNWNWGGTWHSQTGVYDFKKKWGTTSYAYKYHTKIFSEKLNTRPIDALVDEYKGFYLFPFQSTSDDNPPGQDEDLSV